MAVHAIWGHSGTICRLAVATATDLQVGLCLLQLRLGLLELRPHCLQLSLQQAPKALPVITTRVPKAQPSGTFMGKAILAPALEQAWALR
jgi:hypothetical protein